MTVETLSTRRVGTSLGEWANNPTTLEDLQEERKQLSFSAWWWTPPPYCRCLKRLD